MIKTIAETNFNNVANGMGIGGFTINGTSNKTLEETQHTQAFVVNGDSKGYSFREPDMPDRITKAFFTAVAAFLKKTKIKDPTKAVALVLSSETGEFKFAGIVRYEENEKNPDDPGNWTYTTTFNEKDLEVLEGKRTVKKYLCSDDSFKNTIDTVGYDVAGVQFKQERYIYDGCMIVVETLLQILDKEAVAGETVDIEYPGLFTASVSVEGDEKIFAITPDGAMKELVKSDIDL